MINLDKLRKLQSRAWQAHSSYLSTHEHYRETVLHLQKCMQNIYSRGHFKWGLLTLDEIIALPKDQREEHRIKPDLLQAAIEAREMLATINAARLETMQRAGPIQQQAAACEKYAASPALQAEMRPAIDSARKAVKAFDGVPLAKLRQDIVDTEREITHLAEVHRSRSEVAAYVVDQMRTLEAKGREDISVYLRKCATAGFTHRPFQADHQTLDIGHVLVSFLGADFVTKRLLEHIGDVEDLPDTTKRQKMSRDLQIKSLALQIAEEIVVTRLEDEGAAVQRRGNANPAAVLAA